MSDGSNGDVTRLLNHWRAGDPEAFEQLVPLVYDHLHHMAISFMRGERTDHTLQPTALLNELYVRLLKQQQVNYDDRQQFFCFTARLMRNILIDHSRIRSAQRRGGADRIMLPASEDLPWLRRDEESLIDLDRALRKLEAIDERKARLVELRFFLCCTTEEAAEILGVSVATVDRDLKFLKSWLYRELHSNSPKAGGPV